MVNIVAAIKQVPGETDVHVSRRTGKPVFDPEKLVMGHLSRRALEAALRIAAAAPGSTVAALTVGGPESEPMLREALAMGADRAIRLSDKVLVESDGLGVARAIAAAVKRIGGVDLVLTGARTKDRFAGQVGPQVAAILGHNVVTYAAAVELHGPALSVVKTLQGPGLAHLRVPLPAVVSVGDRFPPGRHATTWGIRAAYAKPIDAWSLQDVGLPLDVVGPAASATVLQKVERVTERERASETITGEAGDVAGTALRRLRARGLIR